MSGGGYSYGSGVHDKGSVRHLETKSFSETIHLFERSIKEFEAIVSSINSTCEKIVGEWKGKGRDAFNADYMQVQINLKDVTDIMYDARDALINAQAEYMKADESLSKSYES